MKWELEIPKDKFYTPVINIKWIIILHLGLTIFVTLLTIIAWNL